MHKSITRLLAFAIALFALPATNFAQTTVTSIEPSATNVSDQVPPLAGRITSFAWQGEANTEYSILIKTPQEPALVVAVGARVQSTSYDTAEGVLSVVVDYEGADIIVDENVTLPEDAFILAIDPGDQTAVTGAVAGRRGRAAAAPKTICYGPGGNPDDYKNSGTDFGDDDGLTEEEPTNTSEPGGFPVEARGSFLNTNAFYWCTTAPAAGDLNAGFRAVGPLGAADDVDLFISSGFASYLASRSGKATDADSVALFAEGVQASVDIEDRDGGLFIEASLLFDEGTVSLDDKGATFDPNKKLQTRNFFLGKREDVSFAPEDLDDRDNALGFFGFVSDDELDGATVEVIRIQDRRCDPQTPSPSRILAAAAREGVVIAREVVAADGSYKINVPRSALFPNNAKKSNLITRIVGSKIQESRVISIGNRSRGNRR